MKDVTKLTENYNSGAALKHLLLVFIEVNGQVRLVIVNFKRYGRGKSD
ncbi:hypothetical protein QFZ80_005094 [Paenibacillus sp. V4I7]|nr:hypothetical protein [Paenibacillus sp. V4I7]